MGSNKYQSGVASFGVPYFGGKSADARVYFVDGNTSYGSSGNTGLSPQDALANLNQAYSKVVSGRGDLILMAPGTYTLSATLTLSKSNVRIMPLFFSAYPSVIITSSQADMFEVEADCNIFSNILFQAGHNDVANIFNVADTVGVKGFQVENCIFDPNGKTTVIGINAADATYAMEYAKIVDNIFLTGFDTAVIKIGAKGFAHSIVQKNDIQIKAAKVGIDLADTTASATGYGFNISENHFIGAPDAGADEVGIAIAGTENTTGLGIIADNRYSYCAAAAITANKLSKAMILNYVGDAATGGTLVDPGT